MAVSALMATTLTGLFFGSIETLSRAVERERMEVRVAVLRGELMRAWERRDRFAEPHLNRLEGFPSDGEGESLLEVLQFPYFSEEGRRLMRLSRSGDDWQLTIGPLGDGLRSERRLPGIGRIAWRGSPSGSPADGIHGSLKLRFPDISSRPHETIALW